MERKSKRYICHILDTPNAWLWTAVTIQVQDHNSNPLPLIDLEWAKEH